MRLMEGQLCKSITVSLFSRLIKWSVCHVTHMEFSTNSKGYLVKVRKKYCVGFLLMICFGFFFEALIWKTYRKIWLEGRNMNITLNYSHVHTIRYPASWRHHTAPWVSLRRNPLVKTLVLWIGRNSQSGVWQLLLCTFWIYWACVRLLRGRHLLLSKELKFHHNEFHLFENDK